MNTWNVENGDLVLQNGSFQTLTGANKIEQDLAIASLTPYGSDRFHPRFGSILESMIGSPVGPLTKQTIAGEVQRVITNYQAIQINQLNARIVQGFTSLYGQNDLVQTINSVNVVQSYDSFMVTVTLTTMAGNLVTLNTSVNTSGTASTSGL